MVGHTGGTLGEGRLVCHHCHQGVVGSDVIWQCW